MGIKIGITGFGRIGRMILRAATHYPELEVMAINATVEPEYMAYLLKYDSVHGTFDREVRHFDNGIIIDGREIPCFSSRDPEALNWGDAGVEYLIDATGQFKTIEKASAHLRAGAKKVILTSPSTDAPMFVMGVNHDTYAARDMNVVSNASCTTNALAPIAKILHDNWGFASGLMTTIHAVTASQKTVDSSSRRDWRGGRASSVNIIPSSTGAAGAVGKVIPALAGKLTGMSMRVPTVNVSVVDLTVNLETPTSYAEICAEMKRASETYMKGILAYTEDAVVSSDFIHDEHTSIFDAGAGIMLTDRFVKLIAWYDNEWGYSCKTLELVRHMAQTDAAV
ncbi:MAG: type I glyceraldehyde-3-phosphate dehydrogenase [Oscillospiraceae bacterium]|jgi:glyceraldehyde 3-phosphate dehydrogenase|nr:type I glyceraldehyde-3-phosphate dehydrogenase [Oscillospiraceae bacterium]